MLIPVVVTLMVILLVYLLYTPLQMWTYLRFYHKIQRDFFRKRVTFIPDDVPEPALDRKLYNFIEADQFIATLSDSAALLAEKERVMLIISMAQGMITHAQQQRLHQLLLELQSIYHAPLLVNKAIRNLDRAQLINGQ